MAQEASLTSPKISIVFILPGEDTVPIGGYKVVYEYANRFVRNGFSVHLLYPQLLFAAEKKENSVRYLLHIGAILYKAIKGIIKNTLGFHTAGEWFDLDKDIRKDFCLAITKRSLSKYPKNTVFVVTSLHTAYNFVKTGVKTSNNFYLIQGFEKWGVSENCVCQSYSFGFRNLTIAPFLADCIEKAGGISEILYNGFDFSVFSLDRKIEERNPFEVAMLWHEAPHKCCKDAVSALYKVKEKYPKLHVSLFGVFKRPILPDWFSYVQNPNKSVLRDLYNFSAIFVAASDIEGFGLTVGESMICGCAVACTDNGGFSCMVKNNVTGLLSPIYDTDSLAENICKLISDNELRFRLAKSGNEFIKEFTWDKSYQKFEALVLEGIAK